MSQRSSAVPEIEEDPLTQAVKELHAQKNTISSEPGSQASIEYQERYNRIFKKHNLEPHELDSSIEAEGESSRIAYQQAMDEAEAGIGESLVGVAGGLGALAGAGLIAGSLYHQYRNQKNSDFKKGKGERVAVDTTDTLSNFVPLGYSEGVGDLAEAGIEALYGDKKMAHRSIEKLNPLNGPVGDLVHGHFRQAGRDIRHKFESLFHHHHDPEQPGYMPVQLASTNAAQPSGAVYV